MNQAEVLAAWKPKSIHEVTLECDGTNVGLELPDLADCFKSGGIPMEVVNKMKRIDASTNGDAPQLTDEDLEHDRRYKLEVVRRSLRTVEGTPVDFSPEEAAQISYEAREEIFGYASRRLALPKAS